MPGNHGRAATVDRGTKRILVIGTIAGALVSVEVASRVPAARWASNDWFGILVGTTVALAGITVRTWAVKTLGRYFQRRPVGAPLAAGVEAIRQQRRTIGVASSASQ